MQTIGELPIEAKALLSILIKADICTERNTGRPRNIKFSSYRCARYAITAFLYHWKDATRTEKRYPYTGYRPGLARRLRIASQLVGEVPRDVLDSVSAALGSVGYTRSRRAEG